MGRSRGRHNYLLTAIFIIGLGIYVTYVIFSAGAEQPDTYSQNYGQTYEQQGYSGNYNEDPSGGAGGSCCGSGGAPQDGAASGQAGGGGCCGGGVSGETKPTEAEATEKGLYYYVSKYKDKNVTAKYEDKGCHQEIYIFKGGKLVKALALRGGEISELN